jgi:hypothetical protein
MIDVITGEINKVSEFESENEKGKNYKPNPRYTYPAQLCGDSIMTFDMQDFCLVEFNTKTKTFRKEAIKYSDKMVNILQSEFSRVYLAEPRKPISGFCFEGIDYCLMSLLYFLVERGDSDRALELKKDRIENVQNAPANANGTAGKEIYQYAKKAVIGR